MFNEIKLIKFTRISKYEPQLAIGTQHINFGAKQTHRNFLIECATWAMLKGYSRTIATTSSRQRFSERNNLMRYVGYVTYIHSPKQFMCFEILPNSEKAEPHCKGGTPVAKATPPSCI